MNPLQRLGWNEFFQNSLNELQTESDAPLHPARIAADFGMQCDVIDADGQFRAEISGRLRFDLADPEDAPAVGDWVALRKDTDALALIAHRLPRKTRLLRQAPGKRPVAQVVGTNLDVVFVVSSMNQEFNARRLERYLTAILDGGIQPVIVLTKADLVTDDELSQFRQAAEAVSSEEIPVLVTTAVNGQGLQAIEAFLGPGKTGAFVGSSGVGKSTIVNALMGREVLETADIRESDARGRHTTTHRQLLLLPSGGVVIDTPGMREFHVWGAEEGVEDAFDDIQSLAAQCRFRDCRHVGEPGCAVCAALEEGLLTPERLASFQKLSAEAKERGQRREQAANLAKKRTQKRRKKK